MAIDQGMIPAKSALPTAVSAEVNVPIRGNKYGEQYVVPVSPLEAAKEGNYWTFRNATAGTGVAHTADPTAVNATDAAFILIKNAETSSTGSPGKDLYLDRLWLRNTAAGTAGSIQQLVITVDDGSVARYGSGGGAITPAVVGKNGAAFGGLVYAGNLTQVAAATGYHVCVSKTIRFVIPVAGDQYTCSFKGGGQNSAVANVATDGTGLLQAHFDLEPVICPPGCWMAIELVRASQSAAASWEYEGSMYLR